MRFAGGAVRIAAALGATWLAVGCTSTHLTQPVGQAIVRTGRDYDVETEQGPIAARILPYALIAEQTYLKRTYDTDRSTPVDRCEDGQPDCHAAQSADRILRDWRILYAETSPFGCGENRRACRPRIPGLGVQIWVKRGKVCDEAVIAFRGTVVAQLGSWVSNLHWATRFLPISDQYHQVRRNIGTLVGRVKHDPCYVEGVTRITAVGHSLGAGLAQHATYASGEIERVYGFHPTFVTGSLDPGLPDRKRNAEGLIIERIYEHGEILAYPRYVMRHLLPPPDCNPRVVSVRFDVIRGGSIGQHKLSTFTRTLLNEARGYAPESDPVATRPCS